jgi:undecaprenyl-diphosphatase
MAWDTDTLRFAERNYEATYVNSVDAILRVSLGLSVAVTAGAVVLLLKARDWRAALFWALAIGGVVAVDLPLKQAFHRPTLGTSGGYAFPSGNAMVSVALLLALVLGGSPRWRKKTLVVGVPLVLVYGVALVYAWWHYPTDVLGGWSLAIAWVSCLWLLLLGRRGQR